MRFETADEFRPITDVTIIECCEWTPPRDGRESAIRAKYWTGAVSTNLMDDRNWSDNPSDARPRVDPEGYTPTDDEADLMVGLVSAPRQEQTS